MNRTVQLQIIHRIHSAIARSERRLLNEKKVIEPFQCPICLEHITENMQQLHCTHKFCNPCLSKWNREHNTCPICRKPILSLDHIFN